MEAVKSSKKLWETLEMTCVAVYTTTYLLLWEFTAWLRRERHDR